MSTHNSTPDPSHAGPRRLTGHIAVVTGAANGIGRALAGRLAAEGASIAAVDLLDADETVAEIAAAGGRVAAYRVDISDPDQVTGAARGIANELGAADIVVNNAGIYPRKALSEITLAEWRRVFAVNVESVLLTTQAFAPTMREHGWGRIINLTSNAIGMKVPDLAHYVASKMAVIGLTRATATELAAFGITANAVAPSVVRTPGSSSMPDEAFEGLAQLQAITRVEVPEDLAGTVAFLASDDAAFMTGQTLYVDGGLIRSG